LSLAILGCPLNTTAPYLFSENYRTDKTSFTGNVAYVNEPFNAAPLAPEDPADTLLFLSFSLTEERATKNRRSHVQGVGFSF
jgi:hypothetical protein